MLFCLEAAMAKDTVETFCQKAQQAISQGAE